MPALPFVGAISMPMSGLPALVARHGLLELLDPLVVALAPVLGLASLSGLVEVSRLDNLRSLLFGLCHQNLGVLERRLQLRIAAAFFTITRAIAFAFSFARVCR